MQKYYSRFFFALIMVFALAACSNKGIESSSSTSNISKESSAVSGDIETENSETATATPEDVKVKFTQIEKGIALDTEGRIWSYSLVDELKLFCDSAKFTYISEGNGLMCAIDENGGLWTWGANKSGQLGDGTTTDRGTPQKVLDDVKMVAAYGYNAFAIKNDGSLYQWGYGNCFAKLREKADDKENILTPIAVKTDAKFEYVATGGSNYASVAIDTNGTRYAWGAPCSIMGYTANQIDKKLSKDAAVTPYSLRPISDDTAPKGTYFFNGNATYIIDADNNLYISGGKGSKLDPFDTAPSFCTFAKIKDKVALLVPAKYGTLYIDTDGNIWGWGSNAFKICAETKTPVQITNGMKYTDVAVLDSGSVMAYALGSDGNIYTFGEKDSTPKLVEPK